MRISDNYSHLSFILSSHNFPQLHDESGGVKTMESYVFEINVLKMHQNFLMHNEINNKVSKYKKMWIKCLLSIHVNSLLLKKSLLIKVITV